nr:hypothetical protein [Actinomycetales bacterium]
MTENPPTKGPDVEREFEPSESPDSEEYRAEGPDVTPPETDPVDHTEQRVEIEFDEDARD